MKRLLTALAFIALLAIPARASDPPIVDILAAPQSKVSHDAFSLSTRILGDVPAGWTYRLYFDTDLNQFTGWLPTRGYEYVAIPHTDSVLFVYETRPSDPNGLGGPLSGFGSATQTDHKLSLSVPLASIVDTDGRFAWELMVFDAAGKWQGSYLGRFE